MICAKYIPSESGATLLLYFSEIRLYSASSSLTDFTFHILVQFWTVSNYDWSLKLQLNSTEPILYAAWDPENAHRFHLLKASGRYERIEFERVYNCADMIAVSASGSKPTVLLTTLQAFVFRKAARYGPQTCADTAADEPLRTRVAFHRCGTVPVRLSPSGLDLRWSVNEV